jgi:hypothetical protein
VKRVRNNEKGGVLLYVIMLISVIFIFVPVIISYTSNTALTSKKMNSAQYANDLAVGGIESLITYLNLYTTQSGNPITYFASYPGWGSHTYTTPEGDRVAYYLSHVGPNPSTNNRYIVTMKTSIGEGFSLGTHTLVYSFNGSATGGGGSGTPGTNPTDTFLSTDSNNRDCVPPDTDMIYLGGNMTGSVSSVPHDLNQIASLLSTKIQEAIIYYGNELKSRIIEQMDKELANQPTALTCMNLIQRSCTSIEDVTAAVNKALTTVSGTNIVLNISNSITINNGESTLVWGNESKRVRINMDSLTFHPKTNLTIYGDLYIKNLTYNNGGKLTVNGSLKINDKLTLNGTVPIVAQNVYIMNNSLTIGSPMTIKDTLFVYGSLTTNNNNIHHIGQVYSGGSTTFNNGGKFTVDHTLYTHGDLTVSNATQLTVGKMITKFNLTINNGINVTVTTDLLAGTATLHNTNRIHTMGDFLVQGNLTSNNDTAFNAGGNIAIAGNATIHNLFSVKSGGQTSSLFVNGGRGECGPIGNPWDPARVN